LCVFQPGQTTQSVDGMSSEVLPEALSMSGVDLFKQLLRFIPDAHAEDYYSGGTWKDDLIKLDLQLIDGHRKEAGAPDPLPLEEVPEVVLPASLQPKTGIRPPTMVGVRAGAALTGPAGLATARQLLANRLPASAGAVGVKNDMPSVTVPTSVASSPIVDLRLVALFVAKWKLDHTKTKMLLAKLTPPRRRFVIQRFKTTVTGPPAFLALEKYIKECDWTEADKLGTSISPQSAKAMPVSGMSTGVKRVLTPLPVDAESKRLRPTTPGTVTQISTAVPTAQVVSRHLAAQLGGPATPGAVRPGTSAQVPRPAGVRLASSVRPPVPRPAGLVNGLLHRQPRPVVETANSPGGIRSRSLGAGVTSEQRCVDEAPQSGPQPGELIRNLLHNL